MVHELRQQGNVDQPASCERKVRIAFGHTWVNTAVTHDHFVAKPDVEARSPDLLPRTQRRHLHDIAARGRGSSCRIGRRNRTGRRHRVYPLLWGQQRLSPAPSRPPEESFPPQAQSTERPDGKSAIDRGCLLQAPAVAACTPTHAASGEACQGDGGSDIANENPHDARSRCRSILYVPFNN